MSKAFKRYKRYTSSVILTGDLSVHCSEWLKSDNTDVCSEKNLDVLNAYSLEQAVNFPTNFHCGQLKACMDLVATNITDLHVSSLAPLRKADRVILKKFSSGPDALPSNYSNKRLIWCWMRANVDGLLQAIASEYWHCVFECNSVETA